MDLDPEWVSQHGCKTAEARHRAPHLTSTPGPPWIPIPPSKSSTASTSRAEIDAEAIRYRHRHTGADVPLLRAPPMMANKVFGISFRTPPGDSTGVAHILEHSVPLRLGKYPLKEISSVAELDEGRVFNTFLTRLHLSGCDCPTRSPPAT
ncbi:MAG: hypothetical protein U1F87_13580 [Kiritimatiellia bacterium]